MGGQVTGSGGAGGKSATTANNTGAPAWTSGATGNNALSPQGGQSAAQAGTAVGNPTTAPAGGTGGTVGGSPQGLSGDWSTPGTDAYNNMNNLLTTQPMGNLVNILQSGGMGGTMNSAMNNLANNTGTNNWMDQAAGGFNQGSQNFQNVYNAAGQPGAAQTNLSGMAAGDLVGNNPYINSIVQQGQQQAGDAVNQMFAQGGRYGGGVNQGVLSDSYQNIANQFLGGQYNQDVSNQMNANQLISGEQQGRLGLQNNAATGGGNMAAGLGGLGQGAMQNWMNSQLGSAGIANQGIQNQFGAMSQLGNVQNNKQFDANTIAGVGEQATQSTQNQLNDLINQWGQGDMQDWARLGGLLSAGTGSAGNYGSGTSTTKNTSQAGIGSILGGILSLVA